MSCLAFEAPDIDAQILRAMHEFLADHGAAAVAGVSRATVVVFSARGPEVEARVVETHARLKPTFLAQGLMFGEFYPSCDKPGLHNPAFRPLRSPWPLLVIRPMVEADLDFLLDQVPFVESYLAAQGPRGMLRLAQLLEEKGTHLGPARVAAFKSLLR
jgi:hypothetical protein